jgi:hypothetical protein
LLVDLFIILFDILFQQHQASTPMSAYTQHCINTMSDDERQRQRAHLHSGVQCNVGKLVQQEQNKQQQVGSRDPPKPP